MEQTIIINPGSIKSELMQCVVCLHLLEMHVRKNVSRMNGQQAIRVSGTSDSAISTISEAAEHVLSIIEDMDEQI